jgi:hypothetical protein
MALIQPNEVVGGGIARPTPADVRLDSALIAPHIATAEYRWVVPTLTAAFYEVLVAEKGTSSAFTTSAYQSLWTTHLKSICANAALYEAVPYMVIQAGSNGLYLNGNEYGQTAGVDGLKFYQDTLRQRLEVSAKRLKEYLCDNAANLPGFSSSAADCPGGCDEMETDIFNTIGIVL